MERGGRRIDLLLPFDWAGVRREAIELRPVVLDDQIRWQEGWFATPLALLAELSDIDEGSLRQLRFPDADRVMMEFTFHLPALIADDIANGRSPAEMRQVPPGTDTYPEVPPEPLAPPERPADYIPGIDDDGGFDIADGEG